MDCIFGETLILDISSGFGPQEGLIIFLFEFPINNFFQDFSRSIKNEELILTSKYPNEGSCVFDTYLLLPTHATFVVFLLCLLDNLILTWCLAPIHVVVDNAMRIIKNLIVVKRRLSCFQSYYATCPSRYSRLECTQ